MKLRIGDIITNRKTPRVKGIVVATKKHWNDRCGHEPGYEVILLESIHMHNVQRFVVLESLKYLYDKS